jgi:hypothetical protein
MGHIYVTSHWSTGVWGAEPPQKKWKFMVSLESFKRIFQLVVFTILRGVCSALHFVLPIPVNGETPFRIIVCVNSDSLGSETVSSLVLAINNPGAKPYLPVQSQLSPAPRRASHTHIAGTTSAARPTGVRSERDANACPHGRSRGTGSWGDVQEDYILLLFPTLNTSQSADFTIRLRHATRRNTHKHKPPSDNRDNRRTKKRERTGHGHREPRRWCPKIHYTNCDTL